MNELLDFLDHLDDPITKLVLHDWLEERGTLVFFKSLLNNTLQITHNRYVMTFNNKVSWQYYSSFDVWNFEPTGEYFL